MPIWVKSQYGSEHQWMSSACLLCTPYAFWSCPPSQLGLLSCKMHISHLLLYPGPRTTCRPTGWESPWVWKSLTSVAVRLQAMSSKNNKMEGRLTKVNPNLTRRQVTCRCSNNSSGYNELRGPYAGTHKDRCMLGNTERPRGQVSILRLLWEYRGLCTWKTKRTSWSTQDTTGCLIYY